MINFVVCEDNKYVREINERLISKVSMPYDFDYKIYSYEKYDNKLKKFINTQSDIKIYILDLELPGKSGIDIAREIRKVDWDSIIIILTSHDELELKLLRQKLLIFDFISKFDNYEEKLMDAINMVIKNQKSNISLGLNINKEIHHIKIDNILYIYRNSSINKITIVTNDNEYSLRESLVGIRLKLDSNFYRTHRACYVNINKIEKVDFKDNIIYFTKNKKCDYLSRNYKKGLKEVL